tara:strand:- start:1584 stop:2630 length:1047 start_codon:yes stop_codon:yes gene_type:complete
MSLFQRVQQIGRFDQWWLYKIPMLLSVALLSLTQSTSRINETWVLLSSILLLLAVGGIYAYILNDASDIEEDMASKKPNFFIGKSVILPWILALSCYSISLLIMHFWHLPWPLIALHTVNYAVFIAYSLKPVRGKERGYTGIILGALGDACLPSLFVLGFCAYALQISFALETYVALGLWSLSIGVKYMTWHQLLDKDRDLKNGISTFVSQQGGNTASTLVYALWWPLELFIFALFMVKFSSVILWIALAMQISLELLRWLCMGRPVVILYNPKHHTIVLQEFYELFLPLSIITILINIDGSHWALTIAFTLLFLPKMLRLFREIYIAFKMRHRGTKRIQNILWYGKF